MSAPPFRAAQGLPWLLATLRSVEAPLPRLTAVRDVIAAHDTDELALRDERDALIYAGIDRFPHDRVRVPGAWRGIGGWRKTALDVSGLSNRLFQRIEKRRAHHDDGGYWRHVGQGGRGQGRRGTELRRLPDVTVLPDEHTHWARVGALHADAEEHAKVIKALNNEIRTPTLWQIMANEPSNTALIEPSGLTYQRVQQIRADGRSCGVLPPYEAARAAG